MESGKSIFGSQTSVITPVVFTPLVSMKNEDFNHNQLDKPTLRREKYHLLPSNHNLALHLVLFMQKEWLL